MHDLRALPVIHDQPNWIFSLTSSEQSRQNFEDQLSYTPLSPCPSSRTHSVMKQLLRYQTCQQCASSRASSLFLTATYAVKNDFFLRILNTIGRYLPLSGGQDLGGKREHVRAVWSFLPRDNPDPSVCGSLAMGHRARRFQERYAVLTIRTSLESGQDARRYWRRQISQLSLSLHRLQVIHF